MQIMDLQVVTSTRHSLMSSEPGNGVLRSLFERGERLFPSPLIVVMASSHELNLLLNFAARFVSAYIAHLSLACAHLFMQFAPPVYF